MLAQPEFNSYPLLTPDRSLCDAYADWPFYVRIISSECFLAQGLFYEAMAQHFVKNRAYYSKVFQPNSTLNMYSYIIELFLPAVKSDIVFMLDGRKMPEVALNFLAEYHVMGIFGRLQYHFTCSGNSIMQDDIKPFWNYAHTMLKYSIETLFEKQESVVRKRLRLPFSESWKYRAKLLPD
jgi:hypothetical protein